MYTNVKSKLQIIGLKCKQVVRKMVAQTTPPNKARRVIERYQSMAFFVFVPSAGIALVTENPVFQILAFISAIAFATTSLIERALD